jgi:hypothetical protein
MREAKRHESASQANRDKLYDTNAPGIRINDICSFSPFVMGKLFLRKVKFYESPSILVILVLQGYEHTLRDRCWSG